MAWEWHTPESFTAETQTTFLFIFALQTREQSIVLDQSYLFFEPVQFIHYRRQLHLHT